MTPSPEIETVKEAVTTASILNHVVIRFVGRSQSLTAGATGDIILDPSQSQGFMAKRKYSMTKKAPKIQPVPLKLNYTVTPGTNTSFIG